MGRRYDFQFDHQSGIRNPRPPDPLAFWRRYSAHVASARFSSETDFCSFAILMALPNEASMRVSSAPIAARNAREACAGQHSKPVAQIFQPVLPLRSLTQELQTYDPLDIRLQPYLPDLVWRGT